MWRWLADTEKLQREAYGLEPGALAGGELADFIVWNYSALVKEAGEALDEVAWKPWVPEGRGRVNRGLYLNELVDVGHFLGNLAVAVRCTDEEWEQRYTSKMYLNRQRQRAGDYTGGWEPR